MPEQALNFADDQTGATKAEWTALVEKTLRGKPFEKAMKKVSHDGLTIDALSTSDDGLNAVQPIKKHGEWKIVSPNWVGDASVTNADILEDLGRGASAVSVTVPDQLDENWFNSVFDGVYLDMVPFILIQGTEFSSGAEAMLKLLNDRGYEQDSVSGTLGIDPIGALARAGQLPTSTEEAITKASALARETIAQYPNVAAFVADGTVYSNAGAPASLELAAPLSAAVAYLRAMEAEGIPLKAAARAIQFTVSASANIWTTVAKFRALRRVWASILDACHVTNVDAHINAVSALYMTTRNDPWVNILRGTAACFAAGVGGADTVTTLPHDIMLGSSDKFSRRIARNIQITLLEESSLARVTDPAAGSFSLEKMTDELAQQTMAKFKALEAQGGVLEALRSGDIQSQIAEAETNRSKQIRSRKIPITGVSEFPNIDESPVPIAPAGDEGEGTVYAGETITPLPLKFLAAEFEHLRGKSAAIEQQTGRAPSIYLANLGTASDYTARATFAKNFFEAGGVKALQGNGGLDSKAIVREYSDSNAAIAVVCSSDDIYANHALDCIKQLKDAGCAQIYIAGRMEDEQALIGAGLSDMIFMGCDVVQTLEDALEACDTRLGESS